MADEQLKQEIAEYVDRVWEDVIVDIDKLVQIESVENMDEAKPGEPWGHAPHEALVKACEIAQDLGLEAHDCDGYIGYADLKGAREDYIGLIGHTDIVPLGTGWTFDPLHVTRKDGYLLGRGVLDDKGPLVLAMYAAKYFIEKGEELPYTLRVIIGCNEETSMQDVEWYVENFPQPAFLFTPDADFPLCYGEKGGYSARILSDKVAGGKIVDFNGGIADNAIPNLATATVRANTADLTPTDRVSVEDAGDGLVKLTAHGIGGHASKPAGTINAIGLLVNYLLDNDLCDEGEREFLELDRIVLASTDGSSMGFATADKYFDPLTCIGGTMRTIDGRFEQTIDSRYPTTITGEEITVKVSELAAKHHATVECYLDMVPFVTDPESEAIQTLITTYNEVTGKNAEPFTMGGGTYARHFARAASFGPNDPDWEYPEWVHGEHSADEGVSEELMKQSLGIYILALSRLMKLDLTA
ncbi:MAG: Sapep family Mn(2+)-dependent dipeptidase [Atopobium sp.]|uniref:Sapep family Mn(2+)-dependent dipeptidase n=1 Tax=Atopobium sp. TaxID=1872650 RepID=UPI002A75451E|nr:Sapep family Mn(2+)-dependent dipeptidase [Atopobium sp.]MDY2788272.1 Sapep family Mn(2+)-dependent dipeptidase [Atopobium sp.]